MKITDKIISIPPHISTSWNNVSSLHMSDKDLVVTLKDDTRVYIPKLSTNELHEIFTAHGQFLEHQPQQATQNPVEQPNIEQQVDQTAFGKPFRLLFGTLESLTQALQHNPTYSNLAPLPQEIVEKIEVLGKTLPPEELANFLHPVPGCNCMYCQISRVLKGDIASEIEDDVKPTLVDSTEDEVNEDDLRFEQWTVETIGDKMYHVTNKLDTNEHYSVYLGDPIGCTCGKQNCEHIVAVLRH